MKVFKLKYPAELILLSRHGKKHKWSYSTLLNFFFFFSVSKKKAKWFSCSFQFPSRHIYWRTKDSNFPCSDFWDPTYLEQAKKLNITLFQHSVIILSPYALDMYFFLAKSLAENYSIQLLKTLICVYSLAVFMLALCLMVCSVVVKCQEHCLCNQLSGWNKKWEDLMGVCGPAMTPSLRNILSVSESMRL